MTIDKKCRINYTIYHCYHITLTITFLWNLDKIKMLNFTASKLHENQVSSYLGISPRYLNNLDTYNISIHHNFENVNFG